MDRLNDIRAVIEAQLRAANDPKESRLMRITNYEYADGALYAIAKLHGVKKESWLKRLNLLALYEAATTRVDYDFRAFDGEFERKED